MVSRVRHGASIPNLRHTTSAQSSAMPRKVVALPPVMVTNPSTPSSSAWSIVLNVRESSRPLSASFEPISGRAADHAARNSAPATAGIELRPFLVHPLDVVLGDVELLRVVHGP